MAVVLAVVVVASMLPFWGNGVIVQSFYSTEYDADTLESKRSRFNAISSSIVSLYGSPMEWALGAMIPACVMVFASKQYVRSKMSYKMQFMMIAILALIKFLINNGYNAVNVQMVSQGIQPRITASDMRANTDALDAMKIWETNVSHLITEAGSNYITNTVLRNVVSSIVLKTAPVCERNDDGQLDSSQFAMGLVQSFGFPLRSWQSTMLPSNLYIHTDSYVMSLKGAPSLSNASMPMAITTAANVFIHAMHVSRFFLRWFDPESLPFNISGLIREKMEPDIVPNGTELADCPVHTVSASDLLDLFPPDSSDANEMKWFYKATRALFKKSLSSSTELSAEEGNITFSHSNIWESIVFDAVTFDVMLRKNFYYRKLILSSDNQTLIENTTATAVFANSSKSGNASDIYYDLDISADCGPNRALCVMPRTQEIDSFGNDYQPFPQIKAAAVCLNADGSEEFMLEYFYYAPGGNLSASDVLQIWQCYNRSTTSMWIMSLGSRIEGDAMYDDPAPDAVRTPLDDNRATIVNPRKVYSLTVGRLSWDIVDFAQYFNATCLAGDGNCRGLDYLMDLPINGAFTSKGDYDQVILVGEQDIPVDNLSPFEYDYTEYGGSYLGFGTATRWVSLMTLAMPAEDDEYTQKGDLLLWYNFPKRFWRNATSGGNCSDSVEDYLNHIVNNHYYMDNGLQPSYTAGMYFLFQNGVVRNKLALGPSSWPFTLTFAGNVQKFSLTVSIPAESIVLTGIGTALIVVWAIFAAFCSSVRRRPLVKDPSSLSPDLFAELKANDSKYPSVLLEWRTASNSENVVRVGTGFTEPPYKP